MTEAIEIDVRNIALRELLSPRDGIEWNVVEEYANSIADLPPILVAIDKAEIGEPRIASIDGKTYVLIDGWHRYHAHKGAKKQTILAIVDVELQPEDFFFRAICANKAHGIRFTAAEKKRISKYLFIQENRTAKEISQAIGCSVRHATDLIKSLAQHKKEFAIQLAKEMHIKGISERDIADELKQKGYKASKSSVNRWLQPEPVPTHIVKDKDAIHISPQIGESPKRDIRGAIDYGNWKYSSSKLRNKIESVHVKLAGTFNDLTDERTDFFIEYHYEKESILQYLNWITEKITTIRELVESVEPIATLCSEGD